MLSKVVFNTYLTVCTTTTDSERNGVRLLWGQIGMHEDPLLYGGAKTHQVMSLCTAGQATSASKDDALQHMTSIVLAKQMRKSKQMHKHDTVFLGCMSVRTCVSNSVQWAP